MLKCYYTHVLFTFSYIIITSVLTFPNSYNMIGLQRILTQIMTDFYISSRFHENANDTKASKLCGEIC